MATEPGDIDERDLLDSLGGEPTGDHPLGVDDRTGGSNGGRGYGIGGIVRDARGHFIKGLAPRPDTSSRGASANGRTGEPKRPRGRPPKQPREPGQAEFLQSAPKPDARKKATRGITIAGEALAPLLQRLSIWFARLRAPKGPDGRRAPLYLTTTDTPTLLWQLSDAEALRLGTAVGAFGKYLPLTQQQSAVGIDVAALAECLADITRERFVLEAIFMAQLREQQAAAAAGQEQRAHPTDIPRNMDARSRLFS
jgi:hypothetical protein